MLKTTRLISVAAIAALALPALAGSWPPTPPRKAAKVDATVVAPAAAYAARSIDGFEPVAGESVAQLVQPRYDLVNGKLVRLDGGARTIAVAASQSGSAVKDGYEFVGGEGGWQLSQHKYAFAGGKLVMSDECDHAIRAAKAPTPGELESTRGFSPGA